MSRRWNLRFRGWFRRANGPAVGQPPRCIAGDSPSGGPKVRQQASLGQARDERRPRFPRENHTQAPIGAEQSWGGGAPMRRRCGDVTPFQGWVPISAPNPGRRSFLACPGLACHRPSAISQSGRNNPAGRRSNLTRRSRSQAWDACGRSAKRCRESSACHRQARRLPPLGSAANVAPHSLRSPASLEPAKGDLEKLEPFWEPTKTHSVSDLRTNVEKSCVWALTILAGRD